MRKPIKVVRVADDGVKPSVKVVRVVDESTGKPFGPTSDAVDPKKKTQIQPTNQESAPKASTNQVQQKPTKQAPVVQKQPISSTGQKTPLELFKSGLATSQSSSPSGLRSAGIEPSVSQNNIIPRDPLKVPIQEMQFLKTDIEDFGKDENIVELKPTNSEQRTDPRTPKMVYNNTEYRKTTLDDGTEAWEKKDRLSGDFFVVSNPNSISFLNQKFGGEVKPDSEKLEKTREIQLKRREALLPLNKSLIGSSEEEAVPKINEILSKMGIDNDFNVEQIGVGYDAIRITNKVTGQSQTISLDNWSEERDQQESQVLRSFIESYAYNKDYFKKKQRINELSNVNEWDNYSDIEGMIEKNKELIQLKDEVSTIEKGRDKFINDNEYRATAEKNVKSEIENYKTKITQAHLAAIDLDEAAKSLNEEKLNLQELISAGTISQEEAQSRLESIQAREANLQATKQSLSSDLNNAVSRKEFNENIVKDAYLINSERGNFLSGTTQAFTRGMEAPFRMILNAYERQTGQPYIEGDRSIFGDDEYGWGLGVSTLDYTKSENRSDFSKAIFGVSESLGSALSGYLMTGGAMGFIPNPTSASQKAANLIDLGVFASMYNASRDQMEGEEWKDVPLSEKVFMSIALSAPQMVLEKFGLNEALRGTNFGRQITNTVLKNVFNEVPQNATSEMIEEGIKKNMMKLIGEGILRVNSVGIVEGVTEASQYLTEISIGEIYNIAKEKDFFDTPNSFMELVENIGENAKLGYIGGASLGAVSSTISTINKKAKLSKSDFEKIENTISDVNLNEALTMQIQQEVINGEITQDEADQKLQTIEKLEKELAVFPQEMPVDDKYEASNLLAERAKIQAEIEGKEKTLVQDKTERINEINAKLKEIGARKQTAATTTTETTPTEKAISEETSTENVATPPSENTVVEKPTIQIVEGEESSYTDPEGKFYFKEEVAKMSPGALSQLTIVNPSPEVQARIEEVFPAEKTATNKNVSDVQTRNKEAESKIKNKELFQDGGVFANELGGSGENSVPTNHTEINGIEFVEFSNPSTGDVDVIMTGTSDNDYVGYYRIYENGKPTNKWSSKFENQSRNKANFKTMISGVQSMLPKGHEYTEKTSISTDGLRVWGQQLANGYEVQRDNDGNIVTDRVAINGDAIVNGLGIDVNQGNFSNISVTDNKQFETVKKALTPYLKKLGLTSDNIYWENGTVTIDLPVLKQQEIKQESKQETQKPSEKSVEKTTAKKEEESNQDKTDDEIEKRMAEIEEIYNGIPSRFQSESDSKEYVALEKEMERRERASVFDVPLEKVGESVDALMKKEKEMPNGFGSFIEKRDARETKEVANRYLSPEKLSDKEVMDDFSDALRGNPTTWYADGLKLRESANEASKRGITFEDLLKTVKSIYTSEGYSEQESEDVVKMFIKPIFEGAEKTTENKKLAEKTTTQETKQTGIKEVQDNAKEYKEKYEVNKNQRTNEKVSNVFDKVSKKIADLYQSIKHEPKKEEVKKAYDALVKETKDQYNFIVSKGLKVVRYQGKGEPYASSADMLKDLRDNNTLVFLPNDEAFGQKGSSSVDNIGLEPSGIKLEDGYELTNSEVFRVVHDYFGHGILGNQFGAIGEENATLQHLDLYSQEALPAVIFQTRGQNSWVNFSGENDRANKLREQARELVKQGKTEEAKKLSDEADKLFKFAEPKINILPKKFNFKRHETARRISEQESIDRRPNKRNTELPGLLARYSKENRKTRGVSKKSVRRTQRIGEFSVNIIAEYTLDDKIDKQIKITSPQFKGVQTIYEITDGSVYREMLIKSLENNPHSASVTVHSAEEFGNMRMFITEDGSTGVTLTKEGFLGGGFSMSRPQNLPQLLILGIKEGATTAEAFDTILPDYYTSFGFKAVSRTAFNHKYRPLVKNGNAVKDWDYETYKRFNNGRPDIVFFIYDGGDRDTIEDRVGLFDGYQSYEKSLVQSFDKNGYDQAQEVMNQEAVKRLEFELGIESTAPTEQKTENVKEEEKPTTENTSEEVVMPGENQKRRDEGKFTKDGVEYVRNEPTENVRGKEGELRFTESTKEGFTYKLVEAEELQPSHQNGQRNPMHFIPEAQPKSRTDVGSIAAEQSFANNPRFDSLGQDQDAYSGAPVVNERNEVIQGNNRSAGLKKGYNQGSTQYKQDLASNAKQFGFTKEQVEGMKNPILVREIKVDDDKAIELGNYDVKDMETGGKSRIDAVALSRRIPLNARHQITNLLFKDDNVTLNESIRKNQTKVTEIIRKYLNQAQRTSLSKDGELTKNAISDIEELVKQFLFDGADTQLSDVFENLPKTVQEGVRKSMPYIFGVDFNNSILSDVQNGLIALNQFIASGINDFGEWKNQQDMFNDGKTPVDMFSPLAVAIAEKLNSSKQTEIVGYFKKYAAETKGTEADMFNEATEGKTKEQATKEVFGESSTEKKSSSVKQSPKKTETKLPISDKKTIDKAISFLDDLEKQLSDFGKGTLGVNISVVVLRKAVQVANSSLKAGKILSQAVSDAVEYIKTTNFYSNLNNKQKNELTSFINNSVNKSDINIISENDNIYVYHGGKLDWDIDSEIYVSPDKSEAQAYANGNEGFVSSFSIDKSKIASEDLAFQIIKENGFEIKGEYTLDELKLMELIDPLNFSETAMSESDIKSLFDELKSRGFNSVIFLDNSVSEGGDINNIVVFDRNSLNEIIVEADEKNAKYLLENGYKPIIDGKVIDNFTDSDIEEYFYDNDEISMTSSNEEINNKSSIDKLIDSLETLDQKLAAFGKETLGMNIPVALLQTAVKVAKTSLKAGKALSESITDAIDFIKNSDFYKGLSDSEQKTVVSNVESVFSGEKKFEEIVEKPKQETKTDTKTESNDSTNEKERAFGKKVMESEVSEEIKNGISENAKKYVPISNNISVTEANYIIQEKGVSESVNMVLDFKNQLSPRARVVLGVQLIKILDKEGTSNSYYQASQIADELSQFATGLGQGVQAFSLWNKLSADGIIQSYERKQGESKAKIKGKHKTTFEGAKEGYKSGTKSAGKKATQTVFGKSKKSASKAKAFGLDKSEIEKRKKAALEKLKKAMSKGGGTFTSGGLNSEVIEAVVEYGAMVFADGIRNFKEWSAKIKEAVPGLSDDDLKSVWMNNESFGGKTFDELSKLSEIEEVVSDHFTKSSDVGELSQKLQDIFDLDKDLADGLANEITDEFNRIVKRERQVEIGKKTPKLTKKVQQAIDKISEGKDLSTKEIEDIIFEAFGIEKLTKEQTQKIRDIIKERDSRPEGFLKDEKTRETLSYIDSLNGISKKDIFWSMYYASILSGYETQILNIASNSLNIALESVVTSIEKMMIGKGSLKQRAGIVSEVFSGLLKGLKEGSRELSQILSTGESTRKLSEKIEAKSVLENVNFKGGKMNPANYAKYVGRFMFAVDSAAYLTANGSKKQELAREIAQKEGLQGVAMRNRVSEILNQSEQAYNEAKEQATKEIEEIYNTESNNISQRQRERLIKIRTSEIISELIPDEIQEKANEYSSFVTYNYTPEGMLGTVASTLSGLGEKIPSFKMIVPFTKVVANVLNQQIDYTPYGFLRATGFNFGAGMKNRTTAETIQERNRILIKATLGTIAMVSLYALAKSYEEDDDPYFEISGKGPSDMNKKNQLYSQGWRPYSVKIGNKRISYQYTPLGIALSYVGNWMDNEKYKELGKKDFGAKSAFALKSSATGVLDMSFLTGLSGFFESLSKDSDAEKTSENFQKTAGRLATVFIPNLFKQLDKLYDPTIYDSKSIEASILKEIPVVKHYSDLKPKLNTFGQPVEKQGNRFYQSITKDPIWIFMAKNRIFAPAASPNTHTIYGKEMSDSEFYEYMEKSGKMTYDYLKENLSKIQSDLDNLEEAKRQEYIEKIFKAFRTKAKREIGSK